ncbi:hypothetical protein D3C87_891950 [compost metagenome]
MKFMDAVPVQLLRDWFDYDPEKGTLSWKVDRQKNFAGSTAGSIDAKGYWRVGILGHYYLVHRVCWAIHHGQWPQLFLDHINGQPGDNRICNLRLATRHQNGMNQGPRSTNKSGFKGVYLHRVTGKYAATICFQGRHRHLGLFIDPLEAHEVYCLASSLLFGDFSREARP